jgi:hypothetical protein
LIMKPPGIAAIVLLLMLPVAAWAGENPAGAETENPHGPSIGECGLCHQANAWTPARISPKFNHARFGFPLQGAHAKTPCRTCHASLNFSESRPKSDCVACHQDVHVGELGDDCARCHTPRTFIDRTKMARGHQTTRFPLVGAHLAADCESCHKVAAQGHNSYVNTPTDCVACHLADYNATTNPNHPQQGFPQDCQQCHTPIVWSSGKFPNHDAFYFPIFSGTHKGRWTACTDCHIASPDYSQFSCIQCHAHSSQTDVTSHHGGVSGFQYNPTSCYGCHPTGRAG